MAIVAKDDVWAVGSAAPPPDGYGARALVEHWNGKRWEAAVTPDVGQSQLIAVVGISRNDVWAVGNQVHNTLVEHWDGREWKLIPNTVAPQGHLVDIAAVNARDIWAVGSRGPPWPASPKPLLQHWDGTVWRLVRAPVSDHHVITGIAAVSSRDIWISAALWTVTDYDGGAVVKHLIGTRWQAVPIPRIKGQDALTLVAAAGRNDIWAVGDGYAQDSIEHYHCHP